MTTFTIAWRNIGRNSRRSVLSSTAIAVATMAIVILFSFLEGIKTDLRQNLISFYTGEIRLRNAEYGEYEYLSPLHLFVDSVQTRLAGIERMPGVESAVPRLTVGGTVFQDERRTPVQITGVDFARENHFSSIEDYVTAGSIEAITNWETEFQNGTAESRLTPVAVGSRLLDELGLEFGEQFTVLVRTALRGTNAMTFKPVAVLDFPVSGLNGIALWAPLSRIQHLTLMPDGAGEILARTAGHADISRLVGALRQTNPDLEVQHWTSIETTYSIIETASLMYNFIAIFFFLLASTVIVNTTMMVIFERKREIGMLSAIGMPGKAIVRLFFTESLILSFFGALAGLLVGTGISLYLGRTGIDLSTAMEGMSYEMSSVMRPVVNFSSSLLVFVFSIAVSAVTTWIPTRRIARIQPVDALREE